MQVNNLALAYLLQEVSPLATGGFVNKIQEIARGIFKIKIHTKEGSKDLIVAENALFFSNYSFPVKQNPHSFFSSLRKFLYNKKILSISQRDFDRVVVFEFQDYFLILEFFHKRNVVLTDKNKKILSVLSPEQGKERILKKGKVYNFPAMQGKNPASISSEFLLERFQNSKLPILQTILSEINIAPKVAKEILFQLKIDEKLPALQANKIPVTKAKEIAEKINEFYSPRMPAANPVVVSNELFPFAFSSLKENISIKSMSSALDEFYAQELIQKPLKEALNEKNTGIKRLEFSLDAQQNSREKLKEQVFENKKKADFIYGNFSELSEIINAVKNAQEKGMDKKEVMYKINSALSVGKNSLKKIKVTDINFKKKEIEIETD